MRTEPTSEVKLEIAHVVFIDMVGYSRLAIDEQRSWQGTLNRVVRSTDRFRVAGIGGQVDSIADWRWDGARLFR